MMEPGQDPCPSMDHLQVNRSPAGPPRANKPRNFYESVHLLRGVAAFIVLMVHNLGWYSLPGIDLLIHAVDRVSDMGQVGVTIFFVISGFVLPLSLTKGYVLRDFHRFIARRFVRLEPTYIASLTFAVAILLIKTRVAPNAIPYHLELPRLSVHLLYLVPFTHYEWYNPVYWTLAIEFQFYLTIALLYPVWSRNFATEVIVATAFSCTFLLKAYFPALGLMAKAPVFGVGMLCLSAANAKSGSQRAVAVLLGVVIASLYGIALGEYYLSVAAITTALLIVFWKAPRLRVRYLGTISYSLYVTHYPVVSLVNQTARHFLGAGGNPLLYLVPLINIALSLFVAHLLYQFVERPTQLLSHRISYQALARDQVHDALTTSNASRS